MRFYLISTLLYGLLAFAAIINAAPPKLPGNNMPPKSPIPGPINGPRPRPGSPPISQGNNTPPKSPIPGPLQGPRPRPGSPPPLPPARTSLPPHPKLPAGGARPPKPLPMAPPRKPLPPAPPKTPPPPPPKKPQSRRSLPLMPSEKKTTANSPCRDATSNLPVFLPYPGSCTKYYKCVDSLPPLVLECAPGQLFNNNNGRCQVDLSVQCNENEDADNTSTSE